MDLKGLPVYETVGCPLCHREACHRCQTPLPQGVVSQKQSHWHFASVDGLPGFLGVQDAVCLDCYRHDWAEVYPAMACPV